MKLEPFIEKLTEELEIEGSLASEIPGVFALPLEEGLMVNITSLDPVGVSFRCNFIPFPEKGNEELFQEALRANLFGQGTRGAVIGVNEEKKQLTLIHEIPYIIDYQQFRDTLEDFINTVDFWREESHNYIKGI